MDSFRHLNLLSAKASWLLPRGSRFWAALGLWLALALQVPADPLTQWIWRNPQPFNPTIASVVHGNGLWLGVANIGLIATSPDGVDWDLAGIGTNASVNSCAFGTNRFVLGSSKGVYVSTDGHDWSKAATQLNTVNDVAYGNGQFVAVNFGATVSRSSDGSTWVNQNNVGGVQSLFSRVSFVNGQFFILGYNNSSTPQYFLFTSPDGNTWTGPVNFTGYGLFKVVYGNGIYLGVNQVLLTNGVWSEFRTSPDGTTWTSPIVFTNHIFADAVFANGQFSVLDESGRILTSADGTNWVDQLIPDLFGGVKMTWDGGQYVVGGVFGMLLSSADGTNWVRRTRGPQNSLVSIIHANGLYVAVGGNFVPGGGDLYSVATVATSPDGRNWVEHDPGTTNSLMAVTSGNGRFVAVGTNGVIVTSTDATNWTAVLSPTSNMLWGVAYGGGRFVAAGGDTSNETLATSTDGVNWTTESPPLNFGPMHAITYAQGQFVMLGNLNTALISSDGLLWQPESSTSTNTLRSITFGNGVYVAVGDRGALVTSSNAMTWTNRSLISTVSWYGVAYGNGEYVAVGSPRALAVSSNAVDWTLSSPFLTVSLGQSFGIVAGDNSFLLAGRFGQILESGPFNPPTPHITLKLRVTDRPMLSFTGPEFHGYEIDGSDGLPAAWQTLATDTNLSATTTLPVSAATNSPTRFYRVKLLN
jgi:hypothetical protein